MVEQGSDELEVNDYLSDVSTALVICTQFLHIPYSKILKRFLAEKAVYEKVHKKLGSIELYGKAGKVACEQIARAMKSRTPRQVYLRWLNQQYDTYLTGEVARQTRKDVLTNRDLILTIIKRMGKNLKIDEGDQKGCIIRGNVLSKFKYFQLGIREDEVYPNRTSNKVVTMGMHELAAGLTNPWEDNMVATHK